MCRKKAQFEAFSPISTVASRLRHEHKGAIQAALKEALSLFSKNKDKKLHTATIPHYGYRGGRMQPGTDRNWWRKDFSVQGIHHPDNLALNETAPLNPQSKRALYLGV